jgi:hypothetical protein
LNDGLHGTIDIKPAAVRDQFCTDCRHLVFEWRREDTQRILHHMVNSRQFLFNPEFHLFNRHSAIGASPTLGQFVAVCAISAHFSSAAEHNRSASRSTAALHRIQSWPRYRQRSRASGRLRISSFLCKVAFVAESATDAGGPGRELMNEFSASICGPAAALAVPTPTLPELFVLIWNISNRTKNHQ